MSAEAISVIVTIGGQPYNVDIVGDPDDVMFALNVGRAVSETLVTHRAKMRKLERQASAAECAPPPPPAVSQDWTQPLTRTAECANCRRPIEWTPHPGVAHVGNWRHTTPAVPGMVCYVIVPR